MNRNPLGYDKAYTKIVDYLLQFGTARRIGAHVLGRSAYFYEMLHGPEELQTGDLILLTSMSDPRFRLAWLLELKQVAGGDTSYLLKSAQTGEEVWWSNVGVSYLDRETLTNHPEWRWTNEQSEFDARWFQAARDCDEYLYRPMQVVFLDDTVAELKTRERWGLTDQHVVRKVLWKDATDEQLQTLFRDMEQEHKDKPKP